MFEFGFVVSVVPVVPVAVIGAAVEDSKDEDAAAIQFVISVAFDDAAKFIWKGVMRILYSFRNRWTW